MTSLRLVAAIVLAAAPVLAADADVAAIQEVLAKFDRAYTAKDLDGVASVFTRDAECVYFGPDVSDRWVGFPAIRAGLSAEFKRLKTVTVEAKPATVHVRGDVAWFERNLVMSMVVREGETSLFARSTGVLEKRGGTWLLVQVHSSVGAPRDAGPKD